jgi:RNA polymerase sigma-B factor
MTRTVNGATTVSLPPAAAVWLEVEPPACGTRRARPLPARRAAGVEWPTAGLPHPDRLLDRLARLAQQGADTATVRSEVIQWYLPLAVRLARRFAGRGESLADLAQAAVVGLIGAVDRFDAGRGVAFAAYATPTIVGAIKRHFRDTTWTVRVSRPLQELNRDLGKVTEELAHALHRSPTAAELATRLGVGPEDVQAARLCASAYRPMSFQAPLDGDGPELGDVLGGPDPRIDAVHWHMALGEALAVLSVRDRRLIALRFFEDMSQAQIAVEIGVSQMHVSRLLTQALAQLRAGMLDEDAGDNTLAAGGRREHGGSVARHDAASPRRR